METDHTDSHEQAKRIIPERRSGKDRRHIRDRRDQIRFEADRRKNHGRRTEDRDLWKESLEFD
ncbi:hypothetical protein [Amphritea pacifica]|uniref:Uncharacterized protein n=1 Tax=Amphritea pacifica TaxID=2811233 RepID=A0ABS2W7F6_9GAMM|nr:hypothetical protein [Amphritea pacifica]MBN0987447.1 hypothetical protein [Amphritea pacifica]MBN1005991.1 hypothetical protein [Amphritea pacifica]